MKQSFIIILIIVVVLISGYVMAPSTYYNYEHPILTSIRENFKRMHPSYSKIPIRVGSTSTTENKSIITLCVENPKTKKIYDMNTLMYVAIHELAHVVSKTYGTNEDSHNEEFRRNFNTLLKRAEALGLYNPNIPIPHTYCGINEKH
jgi:hypothetical protein